MTPPQMTAIAPQFLVDDLDRAIAFYRDVLGFAFGPPWGGFYAIGRRDAFELHLKHAAKLPAERTHRHDNEHLDVYARVRGIDTLYSQCVAASATIIRPLGPMPWGMREFFLMDPDGYILAFGEADATDTGHAPKSRSYIPDN